MQALHKPDHAHLVRFAEILAGGPIEHPGGKSHRRVPNGIPGQVEGDIQQQRPFQILRLHGDAIRL